MIVKNTKGKFAFERLKQYNLANGAWQINLYARGIIQ